MFRGFSAFLLVAFLAFAANGQVLQSGQVTVRHPAMWCNNSVVCDAGGAQPSTLSAAFSEERISAGGTPFCIDDLGTQPITAPYHQLCLGANAPGGGLISYNAYGGAAALPLYANINGVTYQFPFQTSGVAGPTTTVINDILCWSNTNGTLTKSCNGAAPANVNGGLTGVLAADTAVLNAQSSGVFTADQILNMITSTPAHNADALRGVLTLNPGSTIFNGDAVAGYVYVNVPQGSGANTAVGSTFLGTGVVAVNGGTVTGLATQLQDNTLWAINNLATGRTLNGMELDFNVTSSHTNIVGMFFTGATLVQPATSRAIQVQPLNVATLQFPWDYAFLSTDGASTLGIDLGAVHNPTAGPPTTNIASQPILWSYWDGAGAAHFYKIFATGGALNFSGDGTQSPFFQFNAVNGNVTVVTNTSTGYLSMSGPSFYGTGSGIYSVNVTGLTNEPLELHASDIDFTSTLLRANGSAGVTCSGAPTSGFATVNGLVTHC